ncbi:hypothetical protein PCE1_000244 [Barthelona sp. PCE]
MNDDLVFLCEAKIDTDDCGECLVALDSQMIFYSVDSSEREYILEQGLNSAVVRNLDNLFFACSLAGSNIDSITTDSGMITGLKVTLSDETCISLWIHRPDVLESVRNIMNHMINRDMIEDLATILVTSPISSPVNHGLTTPPLEISISNYESPSSFVRAATSTTPSISSFTTHENIENFIPKVVEPKSLNDLRYLMKKNEELYNATAIETIVLNSASIVLKYDTWWYVDSKDDNIEIETVNSAKGEYYYLFPNLFVLYDVSEQEFSLQYLKLDQVQVECLTWCLDFRTVVQSLQCIMDGSFGRISKKFFDFFSVDAEYLESMNVIELNKFVQLPLNLINEMLFSFFQKGMKLDFLDLLHSSVIENKSEMEESNPDDQKLIKIVLEIYWLSNIPEFSYYFYNKILNEELLITLYLYVKNHLLIHYKPGDNYFESSFNYKLIFKLFKSFMNNLNFVLKENNYLFLYNLMGNNDYLYYLRNVLDALDEIKSYSQLNLALNENCCKEPFDLKFSYVVRGKFYANLLYIFKKNFFTIPDFFSLIPNDFKCFKGFKQYYFCRLLETQGFTSEIARLIDQVSETFFSRAFFIELGKILDQLDIPCHFEPGFENTRYFSNTTAVQYTFK